MWFLIKIYEWWTLKDSNLGPIGYEPIALTNWANGPRAIFGRGEETRTPGPMVPNHVRYQTALHPVAIIDKLLSFASRLTYNTIYFYICQEFFATFFKIIFFYKFWQKPKQIKGFFDEKSIFHNNFYTYVIVFIKTASKIFHMPNFYKSYTTITTTTLILYFLNTKN